MQLHDLTLSLTDETLGSYARLTIKRSADLQQISFTHYLEVINFESNESRIIREDSDKREAYQLSFSPDVISLLHDVMYELISLLNQDHENVKDTDAYQAILWILRKAFARQFNLDSYAKGISQKLRGKI